MIRASGRCRRLPGKSLKTNRQYYLPSPTLLQPLPTKRTTNRPPNPQQKQKQPRPVSRHRLGLRRRGHHMRRRKGCRRPLRRTQRRAVDHPPEILSRRSVNRHHSNRRRRGHRGDCCCCCCKTKLVCIYRKEALLATSSKRCPQPSCKGRSPVARHQMGKRRCRFAEQPTSDSSSAGNQNHK